MEAAAVVAEYDNMDDIEEPDGVKDNEDKEDCPVVSLVSIPTQGGVLLTIG